MLFFNLLLLDVAYFICFCAYNNIAGMPTNSFGQTAHNNEPSGTPDLSPCGANDNSGEVGASQLNRIADDADDDDPFAKRRYCVPFNLCFQYSLS